MYLPHSVCTARLSLMGDERSGEPWSDSDDTECKCSIDDDDGDEWCLVKVITPTNDSISIMVMVKGKGLHELVNIGLQVFLWFSGEQSDGVAAGVEVNDEPGWEIDDEPVEK